MSGREFHIGEVDLDALSRFLRDACGATVEGAVVGRTALRDAVLRQLQCSELQAEIVVDTMISRGLIRRTEFLDGRVAWSV